MYASSRFLAFLDLGKNPSRIIPNYKDEPKQESKLWVEPET